MVKTGKMLNRRGIAFLSLCTLFIISCKQNTHVHLRIEGDDTYSNVTKVANNIREKQRYVAKGYPNLYLEKDSGYVYCYADSQQIVFGDIYLDSGAMAMMLYPKGRYAYIIGDIVPNSDGWTVRYHLYRIDTQTFETKHIGDFAAICFEDNGFKAAVTRLTNPDAACTAEEVFAIHDIFFNDKGQQIRESSVEYRYDEMETIYSDSLVNADGFRYSL